MNASALLGLSLATALASTVALVIRAYRSASRYRVAVSWWGNDPDMPRHANPSRPPAPRFVFELR
ncbi:MAG TPA: hypothetical protein VNN80_04835, partial [Polyangiaceae bacterium]|nr:hypothetical protein [Polyangiaceae bacterium]